MYPVNANLDLYLVVDETMEVHERAHTFRINKAALALQIRTPRRQLDALGNQLNLLAMVDGVIHDWIRYFQDNWYNFNWLTILSFHDVKSDIISNTTTATNSTVLMPVQNGEVVLCPKGNIKFVHV